MSHRVASYHHCLRWPSRPVSETAARAEPGREALPQGRTGRARLPPHCQADGGPAGRAVDVDLVAELFDKPEAATTDLNGIGTVRLIAVVGVVLCAAATIPLALGNTHSSWILLGAALIVRGGALSAVNIAITTGAFVGLSREQVPAGSAIVRLAQQLGGAAGTALLATIAVASGALGGFHAAFWWSIGLTLVALIPCLAIPAPNRPQEAAPQLANAS